MDDNQTNSAFLALFLPVLAGQSGDTGCQAATDVASMGLFLGLATVFVR
jgi:Mg/Co/Ni transporter MgtE